MPLLPLEPKRVGARIIEQKMKTKRKIYYATKKESQIKSKIVKSSL